MTAIQYFLKLNRNDVSNSFTLNSPLVSIGASNEATIPLPQGTADERHCRIEWREQNQYVIRDLRSKSGTFVNGARILEAYLNDGDVIRINDTTLEFQTHPKKLTSTTNPLLKSRNARWNQKLASIPNMARSPFPVLILGPSGSGKELIAQSIHKNSLRAGGPFLTVNCSALSENLVESELFGHVRGSFTGAISDRKGAFEAARGGSLFLDEIGDLPYGLQAKLLRALENNEIRAVGSDKNIKTDVRIIAATHQNLHERITNGSFRSDLFYRLNVITIQTPSLLERIEDFDDIFFSLCKEARVRFSFQAIEMLKRHRWPGNIRELKNVVSRGAALYSGSTVDEVLAKELIDDIPFAEEPTAEAIPMLKSKTNIIKEMERQMILERLIANKGNQRRTANDLGMPKSTLHDRLKAYRIDLETLTVKESEEGHLT